MGIESRLTPSRRGLTNESVGGETKSDEVQSKAPRRIQRRTNNERQSIPRPKEVRIKDEEGRRVSKERDWSWSKIEVKVGRRFVGH